MGGGPNEPTPRGSFVTVDSLVVQGLIILKKNITNLIIYCFEKRSMGFEMGFFWRSLYKLKN